MGKRAFVGLWPCLSNTWLLNCCIPSWRLPDAIISTKRRCTLSMSCSLSKVSITNGGTVFPGGQGKSKNMKNTTVSIYPELTTLSQEAALYIVRAAQESIVTHGRFTLALSGGGTPKQTYTLLGREPYRDQIDWALVEIFWSDERCVPAESEDSSYRMAMEAFLSKVPIPASQIHRVPADNTDRDAASLA